MGSQNQSPHTPSIISGDARQAPSPACCIHRHLAWVAPSRAMPRGRDRHHQAHEPPLRAVCRAGCVPTAGRAGTRPPSPASRRSLAKHGPRSASLPWRPVAPRQPLPPGHRFPRPAPPEGPGEGPVAPSSRSRAPRPRSHCPAAAPRPQQHSGTGRGPSPAAGQRPGGDTAAGGPRCGAAAPPAPSRRGHQRRGRPARPVGRRRGTGRCGPGPSGAQLPREPVNGRRGRAALRASPSRRQHGPGIRREKREGEGSLSPAARPRAGRAPPWAGGTGNSRARARAPRGDARAAAPAPGGGPAGICSCPGWESPGRPLPGSGALPRSGSGRSTRGAALAPVSPPTTHACPPGAEQRRVPGARPGARGDGAGTAPVRSLQTLRGGRWGAPAPGRGSQHPGGAALGPGIRPGLAGGVGRCPETSPGTCGHREPAGGRRPTALEDLRGGRQGSPRVTRGWHLPHRAGGGRYRTRGAHERGAAAAWKQPRPPGGTGGSSGPRAPVPGLSPGAARPGGSCLPRSPAGPGQPGQGLPRRA